MKWNMLVTVGTIGVLMAAAACTPATEAPPAKEASIEVTADQFADTNQVVREVELAEGGTLTVTLGSNPSTGFSWPELAPIEDETVLRQVGGGGSASSSSGQAVGAPGVQEWTFEALKKGATTILWTTAGRGRVERRASGRSTSRSP